MLAADFLVDFGPRGAGVYGGEQGCGNPQTGARNKLPYRTIFPTAGKIAVFVFGGSA
ncbi:MAG: hypothetical protein R3B47_01440 [Bacteroidia bacterium]